VLPRPSRPQRAAGLAAAIAVDGPFGDPGRDIRTVSNVGRSSTAMAFGFHGAAPATSSSATACSLGRKNPGTGDGKPSAGTLSFHTPGRSPKAAWPDPGRQRSIQQFLDHRGSTRAGRCCDAPGGTVFEDLSVPLVTGLVDFFRSFSGRRINFPAVWTDSAFSGVLPRGTPVAQCFPVLRTPAELVSSHSMRFGRRPTPTSRPCWQSLGSYRKQFRARRGGPLTRRVSGESSASLSQRRAAGADVSAIAHAELAARAR